MNTVQKLKQVIQVLESNHVSQVEATFERSAEDINYYNVFTRKGFEVHRYQVRMQSWFNAETLETERIAACNCRAAAKGLVCRHAIKAAQVDTEKFGRHPLFIDSIINYKAHNCYGCKAA